MAKYSVRFVHKVSASSRDVHDRDIELPDEALSDRTALAKALRAERVLLSGARVREFRRAGGKVSVFPTLPGFTTYWHAVILERLPDFRVTDHGSVCLLRPDSKDGKAWAEQNLPEDAQRMGDAYAVEPRYLGNILDGIHQDGLLHA